MDDLAAGSDDLVVQRVDIGRGIGGKGDHFDVVHLGLVQAHDMVFVMALGLEPPMSSVAATSSRPQSSA
jgi:hypothetical protein